MIFFIENLRFKTQAAVGQRSKAVIVILVDHTGKDDCFCRGSQSGSVIKKITAQTHFHSRKHFFDHEGISACGYTLITVIKVIIVVRKTYRQTSNQKCRKLGTGTAPLLLRITLHQLFVNGTANKRNGLFLQVRRFRITGTFAGYLFLCLGRSNHTPDLIEGIHIERQIINFVTVNGNGSIGEAVKICKAIHVGPYCCVACVKNMGAIAMNIDTSYTFGKNITGDMIPFVYNQTFFSSFTGFMGKNGAEKSRANY